jgi:predicted acylesterase/phospholipase RssA
MRGAAAAVAALALLVAACGRPPPREPEAPPVQAHTAAEVPGFPGVRSFFRGSFPLDEAAISAFVQERRAAGLPSDRFTILALSGGGEDGAYGAGLLLGWAKMGDRPQFDVVTGISTGALIAPFAFLGPDFDDELRRFYTETSTPDVAIFDFARVLGGAPAFADTAPLRRILEEEVTPEFVALIAAEHRRGRRLVIGTTNLDAQRATLWNIGAIAATGRPDAPALIRGVMLASAAIPGAFPPVLLRIEADGAPFQELHVDGGVTLSIFAYPPALDLGRVMDALGVPPQGRTLYLIRNAKLRPEYAPTELGLVPIVQRSVSTLIKSQTIGNLIEIELVARRDRINYRLAYVPDDFAEQPNGFFDPVYMRALFDRGEQDAMQAGGYPWQTSLIDILDRQLPPLRR